MIKTYFLEINELKKMFSYEELYNKVSSYRKEKVDRLKFENDKWLSLGAEYLLIKGLKELNIDYSKTEIEHIENGKPIFKGYPQNIHYNLSHSGEMAMCVISDSEVGCDIQKIYPKENFLDIAKRFYHPKEYEMIINAEENEKLKVFYRIWVLKESYIKVTGKGLQTTLQDFRISFENNDIKLYIKDIQQDKYYFIENDLENPDYKSATCIEKQS